MSKIETGVDKLVELVNSEKKISVDDAAKKLGVSKVVIEEWADFLEEEKIISIEYKFNKTLLVERKLTTKEVKDKAEEFINEKDAFIRKVETSMKSLDRDTGGLEKIKDEFSKLKKEIGGQIEKVKGDVTELEKYNSLKNNLDKEIENMQQEYQKLITKAHEQIRGEELKYKDLQEKISSETRDFESKEKDLKTLEGQEAELRKKLTTIADLAKAARSKIDTEEKELELKGSEISGLMKVARQIEAEVGKKKTAIERLIAHAEQHEKQIAIVEENILKKVKDKATEIKSKVRESELATSKFQSFFARKKEIEELINKIDKDKELLREELNVLVKRATVFDISTKSTNIKQHIAGLEKELNKVEGQREEFKNELHSLLKLVKG